MAYTKINWVNDQTEVSAENMNHMEEGIENAYSVWLVAVTDVEPEECYVGDIYFDTETKLLYKAIERNVWDNTGYSPEIGVMYVVFSTQTVYSYNGTTLVSVGGGGGGGIAVAPDEPDEDTKLYIESTDLDFQGLEIANEYTTGDNIAYSADYVNTNVGVVESGSNTYGNYVKYNDGTMICTRTVNVTGTPSEQWGSFYVLWNNTEYNFASDFISAPNVTLNAYAQNSTGFWLVSYDIVTITGSYIKGIGFARPNSLNINANVNILAVGRWK